jgi:hypothetical protein
MPACPGTGGIQATAIRSRTATPGAAGCGGANACHSGCRAGAGQVVHFHTLDELLTFRVRVPTPLDTVPEAIT